MAAGPRCGSIRDLGVWEQLQECPGVAAEGEAGSWLGLGFGLLLTSEWGEP